MALLQHIKIWPSKGQARAGLGRKKQEVGKKKTLIRLAFEVTWDEAKTTNSTEA